MVSAMSEKDIHDAFCVIDVDGDGSITLDELRNILTNFEDSFTGNHNCFKLNSMVLTTVRFSIYIINSLKI